MFEPSYFNSGGGGRSKVPIVAAAAAAAAFLYGRWDRAAAASYREMGSGGCRTRSAPLNRLEQFWSDGSIVLWRVVFAEPGQLEISIMGFA